MVKWRQGRKSDNVDDRRGAAAAGGAGILLMLLRLIVGRFGIRGVFFLALIGGGLYLMGVNPMQLVAGGGMGATQSAEPIDDEASQFVRANLASTEDVWTRIFAENNMQYPPPTLVLFSGQVSSACGYASAASGPFYCPADRKVYLDTSFFTELQRRFGAPGDFAAAYVIAHEVGHHVQTVTGVSEKVRAAQQRASKAEANRYQVMMELQADCYAGVWANRAEQSVDYLDDGDIEEGLRAAAAIGDDTLQRNAGRRVTPESFTHGTSEQRQRWFTIGLRSGDTNQCDTFNAQRL